MSNFEITLLPTSEKNVVKSKNVEIFEVGKFNNYFILYLPFSRKLILFDKKTYGSYKRGEHKFSNDDFIWPIFPPVQYINKLFVVLTEDCNLRCIYCYANAGQSKKIIEVKNVVKATEKIFYKFNFPNLEICFYGGEPTICFPQIKEFVDNIKKTGIKFTFAIQSNGFFSHTVRNFLYHNFHKIGISCDGPPDIQNSQRKLINGGETSQRVEENIKFFVKNKKMVSTSAVMTKNSIKKLNQIVEYFNDLGLKNVSINLMKEEGSARNFFSSEIFSKTDEIIPEFIKAFELAEEYKINLHSDTLSKTMIANIYCNASSPHFFVYPDGSIFSCPIIDNNKEFCFGKYDKSKDDIVLFSDKVKSLQKRRVENITDCNECFVKWQCAGGCPADALRENHSIFKPYSKYCILHKRMTKKYFEYKILKYFNASIPRIFEVDKKLTLKMIFNEFELKKVDPDMKFKDNPWIIINKDFNLDKLFNKILYHRQQRLWKTTLFLLTLDIKKNLDVTKKFLFLIKKLKEKRILFKVTKPIPSCNLILSKVFDEIRPVIPMDCFQCLQMYSIKDNKIIFCNGKEFKKNMPFENHRVELFNSFKTFSKPTFLDICKQCVYNLRSKCMLNCFKSKDFVDSVA